MPRRKSTEDVIQLMNQTASNPEIEEKRQELRSKRLLDQEKVESIKTRLELSRKEAERTEVDRDDQIQSIVEDIRRETGAVRYVVSRSDTSPSGITRWIGHLGTINHEELEDNDIEAYIKARWGGGKYKISIHSVDGRVRHVVFRTIAGKSKPVDPEEEDDEQTMVQIPDGSAHLAEVVRASMDSNQAVLNLMATQSRESNERSMELMAKIMEASKPKEKESIPWDKIMATIPALMAAFASLRKEEMSPGEWMKIIMESQKGAEAQTRAMLDMYPAAMQSLMTTQSEMTSLLMEKMADKMFNTGNEDQDPMSKMMDKLSGAIPSLIALKQGGMPNAAQIAQMQQQIQSQEEDEGQDQVEGPEETKQLQEPPKKELSMEEQAKLLKKMRIVQFFNALKSEILSESEAEAICESYEQAFFTLPKSFRDSINEALDKEDVSIFINSLTENIGEDESKKFLAFITEDMSRLEWILAFLRGISSEEENEDDGSGQDSGTDQSDSSSGGDGIRKNTGTQSEPGRSNVRSEETEGVSGEEREAHTETAGDRAES